MDDVVRALVDRMRALVAVYDRDGEAAFRDAFARGAIHVLSREISGERQRLEAIADSMPGLVGFVDMEARYQYVNASYETWLAQPRAFLLGKRIRDIAPPGAYATIEPQVDRALRGERVQFRQRVTYPSGVRDVDVQYLPVQDSAGVQIGFAILVLDVTSEIALAESRARTTDRLQRLLAVAGQLAVATSPEEVGNAVVDAGVSALDATMAGVWLVEGESLVLLRASGFTEEHHAAFAKIALASTNPIATAARERTPFWIGSRDQYAQQFGDTEAAYRPQGAPPLAFGAVPILIDGAAVGALAFVFHDERRLTAEERTYIEVLAAQSSDALSRARLHARLVEALAISEAMIQSSPAAIVLLDSDARVHAWNATAERVFGWRAADVIGKVPPVIAKEQMGVLYANIAQVLGGEPLSGFEATRTRADGSRIDLQIYAAPVKRTTGEVQCLTMMFDITERKRIERGRQLVADTSALLGRSLDWEHTATQLVTLPVPVFVDWCMVHLLDGNMLRAIAMTGSATSEGLPVTEHRPDQGAVSRAISTGETQVIGDLDDTKYQEIARDATHLAQMRGRAMRSYMAAPMRARDQVIGAFLFGSRTRNFDAVDRAIAEGLAAYAADAIENARLYRDATTARAEAEAASQAKDQFLAMLGHELRNPLAPITTALELMALRPPPHTREREVIGRQVMHLTRLVDDLLDVSRITRGKIDLAHERVTIASVVARAVELASPLLEQRSHVLSVDVADELAVEGDPTRLAQVVANLLTNAARYTPAGGHIDVTARRDDGQIVLRVRDNGIGIASDSLVAIFDIFVQGAQSIARTEGGLGLGLAIVRSLVQMHGGTVVAQSDGLGHGAMFEVKLPAAGPSSAEMRAVAAPPPAKHTRRRVLVVDDNTDAAELLAELLADHGHEVRTAHDGPDALRVAAELRPEVALLDIGLPVMDGYELAQRLRETVGPLRLIAVTGYGQAADRERSREAGFDVHLAKPVAIAKLYDAVDE